MTQQLAAREERGFWTDFLELTRGAKGERELVLATLHQSLREVAGTRATLVFATDDGGSEELVARAATRVPSEPETDPVVVSIPGGEVRYLGVAHGQAPSAQTVATLSVAVHAYKLCQRVKQHRFEVNYRGVELEALYDVGLAIASTLNLDELAEEILSRAVSLLDARRGALYLLDDEELALRRTVGGDARARLRDDSPELAALLESVSGEFPELLPGSEYLLGVRIETEDRRSGLLVVGDKESRQGVGPFAQTDRRTLSLFATQAAIALENARLHRQALEQERMQREAELAADIQRQLLPSEMPELDGFEIIGWNRSARLVGGDYYNFLPSADGRLASVVADVTGKGMPAALLVSTLHSALQLLLERGGAGPEMLERLNHHIVNLTTSNKFITLFLADVDGKDGSVRFVNAGHNPPILARADGETIRLPSAGFPIGLFAGATYELGSLQMDSGDLLCCFSDGITECESPDDEEFGEPRLVELLASHRLRPLGEVLAAVDEAVTDFAAGSAQGDDQTVVLLRRR